MQATWQTLYRGHWDGLLGCCVRWLWLLGLALALRPGAALAEDAETLKQALETMRQEFELMKQQYERRLQELSDRIKQLEAQPSLPTSSAPAPAQASPQASESPALRELLTPRQPPRPPRA